MTCLSIQITNSSGFNFSFFYFIILSQGCGKGCRSSGSGPSEGVQDSQRPIRSVADFALQLHGVFIICSFLWCSIITYFCDSLESLNICIISNGIWGCKICKYQLARSLSLLSHCKIWFQRLVVLKISSYETNTMP